MALGKILRRGFLVGSAAIAGGVAFGTYRYVQPFDNPLKPGPGEVTLNPYVLIRTDGISIVTPRAEMGQGIHTTLAAMVAEELDVAWDQITAIHGPTAEAYLNAPVMALGLPYREYEQSRMRQMGVGAVRVAQKLALGIQLTGGSTSTIDGYEKMRRAGAAARLALIEAAGERWDLPPVSLNTEDGKVIDADGRSLTYQELAEDAALVPPAVDPPLREPAKWRYLGTPMPRLDMEPKITGQAEYATDVKAPEMLFASVMTTPFLGGTMLGLDASDANDVPGVVKTVGLGNGVAVVADTTWTAMRALEKLQVTWSAAPYAADTEAQFAEINRALEETSGTVMRDDGLADVVIRAAKTDRLSLLRARYSVPFLAHACMEPMTATALYQNDRLTIWCGTQVPTFARDKAAAHVGLDPSQVDIVTTFMGGGFGRRTETDFTTQAAQIARSCPDRPVRMTWTREHDMSRDFYRPAAMARLSGAIGAGRPEAIDMRIAAPSVFADQSERALGFAPPVADKLLVEGAFDQPYNLPNFRVIGHQADLRVPVGSWRSVGHSHNSFFLECFLDELADAAGLDPVEMRLKMLDGEHMPSARTVETVAAMANWGGEVAEGTGRGISFCHCFGSSVAQVVQVSDAGGRIAIDHIWCAVDVGLALDPRIVTAQVQSGVIYGLSAALFGEITFADGRVQQSNFHDYPALRIDECPPITVRLLQ
ncbi:MAG: molybdopterin cofactor-binding domain-containing protein, partial [Pseudomonadota bacterium]